MASIGDLPRRVVELERKVDFLLKHLDLTYESTESDLASQAVIDLVWQGEKIEAIKLLREETGLGLKEAKDIVDAIEAQRRGGAF